MCKKNRVRDIREILSYHIEDISNMTDISVDKLKIIEAGGEVSLAELRDLAICLNTSVNVIKQQNYFEPQIATYFIGLNDDYGNERISGFWGHRGI